MNDFIISVIYNYALTLHFTLQYNLQIIYNANFHYGDNYIIFFDIMYWIKKTWNLKKKIQKYKINIYI